MRGKDLPSKREVVEALESMCMGLAIWHGSIGSVAEAHCEAEVRKLAASIFRGATAQGMMQIQQAVLHLIDQEERAKKATNGATDTEGPVVDVPPASREESAVPDQPISRETMGVPEPRGEGVEGSTAGTLAGGPGEDGLEDP